MPGALFDTHVWLAALFTTHPFHMLAKQSLQQARPAQPALLCRATQQSFLRLACTSALLKVYGAEGLSNRDALVALDAYLAAFAVAGKLRLVTLDRNFKNFVPQGLDLTLLV